MNHKNPDQRETPLSRRTRVSGFLLAPTLALATLLNSGAPTTQASQEYVMSLTSVASNNQGEIDKAFESNNMDPLDFPLITSSIRKYGEDITRFEPEMRAGASWTEIATRLGDRAVLQQHPQVGGESLSVEYDISTRRIRPDMGTYLSINPALVSEEAVGESILVQFPGEKGTEFELDIRLRNLGTEILFEAHYLPNLDRIPSSHPKRYRFSMENQGNTPQVVYLGVVQQHAKEVRLIGNAEKAIYVPNGFHTSDGITTHLPNPSR